MKLSTRGRYALRMMLDMIRHDGAQSPVSLASVSERTGLSRGYLEQLALVLRNAGLLRAVSGRRGGYRVARAAKEIAIGEILEAVMGPVCIVGCLNDPESCPRVDYCECRVIYDMINRRMREAMHGYSLADLLDPSWVQRQTLTTDDTGCPPYPGAVAAVAVDTKKKPQGTTRRRKRAQPARAPEPCGIH